MENKPTHPIARGKNWTSLTTVQELTHIVEKRSIKINDSLEALNTQLSLHFEGSELYDKIHEPLSPKERLNYYLSKSKYNNNKQVL